MTLLSLVLAVVFIFGARRAGLAGVAVRYHDVLDSEWSDRKVKWASNFYTALSWVLLRFAAVATIVVFIEASLELSVAWVLIGLGCIISWALKAFYEKTATGEQREARAQAVLRAEIARASHTFFTYGVLVMLALQLKDWLG